MITLPPTPPSGLFQLSVHGLAAAVQSAVPGLDAEIRRLLGAFEVPAWPEGFQPVEGVIHPYDEQEVLRHLSPTAQPVPVPGDLMELYCEDERFWLIDDHWGLCEINLLKGKWRSWILAQPALDPFRCVEQAVLWPMAQLLRVRGLTLIPAASVARDGFGMLMISPFGIEPELTALIRSGFKVIGQRWTALREDGDGRVEMLWMPGQVERTPPPRPRSSPSGQVNGWVDLNAEFCGSTQNHAFCDAALLIEPGRRPGAMVRPIGKVSALPTLRKNWPIVELHPHRKHGQIPARLARTCRCFETHLSRRAGDILDQIDLIRYGRNMPGTKALAG